MHLKLLGLGVVKRDARAASDKDVDALAFDGVWNGDDGRLDHVRVVSHGTLELGSANAVARDLEVEGGEGGAREGRRREKRERVTTRGSEETRHTQTLPHSFTARPGGPWSYVDDVVHTARDPVVAVLVATRSCERRSEVTCGTAAAFVEGACLRTKGARRPTVAGAVVAIKLAKVGHLKPVVVAVHCAHLSWPGLFDDKVALACALKRRETEETRRGMRARTNNTW